MSGVFGETTLNLVTTTDSPLTTTENAKSASSWVSDSSGTFWHKVEGKEDSDVVDDPKEASDDDIKAAKAARISDGPSKDQTETSAYPLPKVCC